ncbi:MAG: porin [Magnetospirillum sp.]|nr:porin [Magnetospirillum sp.]
MKKVLIASTALVAAGLMSTGTASAAEKIKLDLGGFSKWWVVGAWQDKSYEAVTSTQRGAASNVDVKGDNEIFFSGETKLDNGLKVGVMVEMEAGGNHGNTTNSGTSTTGAGDVIDKSYIFVEGGFGKVILGSEANGTVLLHVMAPDAAANWGSENQVFQSVAQPTANFATKLTTEIDTDDNTDKVTYVAPTFYGLTLGASYIPNVLSEDDARTSSNLGVVANGVLDKSIAAYGVGGLYANTFGPVGLKVSGGLVTYDADARANGHNSYEWSAGTQLTYGGFTLGGSYRHVNIDNNLPTSLGAAVSMTDGRAWDLGLQYASGPWAVSVAYFDARADDNATTGKDKTTLYQASGKYAMGPGVDLLATVGHVEYDDETAKTAGTDLNHNKGWAVMSGVSLAF